MDRMQRYFKVLNWLYANIKDRILYDNHRIVVVNKPAGIPTEKDSNYPLGLDDVVREHCKDYKIEAMHRLDLDASGGLMLVRDNETYEKYFGPNWRQKTEKHYIAVVAGKWKTKHEKVFLSLNTKGRLVKVDARNGDVVGKAIFTTIHANNEYSVMGVQILNGPKHLIRVLSVHMGHAILGDPMYASQEVRDMSDTMLLHAHTLKININGEFVEINAPLPEYFNEFVN